LEVTFNVFGEHRNIHARHYETFKEVVQHEIKVTKCMLLDSNGDMIALTTKLVDFIMSGQGDGVHVVVKHSIMVNTRKFFSESASSMACSSGFMVRVTSSIHNDLL